VFGVNAGTCNYYKEKFLSIKLCRPSKELFLVLYWKTHCDATHQNTSWCHTPKHIVMPHTKTHCDATHQNTLWCHTPKHIVMPHTKTHCDATHQNDNFPQCPVDKFYNLMYITFSVRYEPNHCMLLRSVISLGHVPIRFVKSPKCGL